MPLRSFVPLGPNYPTIGSPSNAPPTLKSTYVGIGFDRDGNIITGYYVLDRSNLYNNTLVFDPQSVTTDPTVGVQSLSTRKSARVISGESAGFASRTGFYGWVVGAGASAALSGLPNEVSIFKDAGDGTLAQDILGPHTLLDPRIDAIAFSPTDHSVYVGSGNGVVNVYAASENGDAAPIQRISGTSTGLNGTAAIFVSGGF